MTAHTTTRLSLELPRRAVVTLPDAAGVDIECRRGSVWVTLDHDRRDIVLAPGEHFVARTHRRALVSALEASCIRVSSDRPAALPFELAEAAPQPGVVPASQPGWRGATGLSPA